MSDAGKFVLHVLLQYYAILWYVMLYVDFLNGTITIFSGEIQL